MHIQLFVLQEKMSRDETFRWVSIKAQWILPTTETFATSSTTPAVTDNEDGSPSKYLLKYYQNGRTLGEYKRL